MRKPVTGGTRKGDTELEGHADGERSEANGMSAAMPPKAARSGPRPSPGSGRNGVKSRPSTPDELPDDIALRGRGGTDFRPGFEWPGEQGIQPYGVPLLHG